MTPEGRVESYLVQQCTKRKYLCYKFVSPGNKGVPDRIVIGNGHTVFVELKAKSKVPRALQLSVHRKMRAAGADVRVADTVELIDKLMKELEE